MSSAQRELEEMDAELDLLRAQLDEIDNMVEPEGGDAVRAQILSERQQRVDDIINRYQELEESREPVLKRAQEANRIREAAKDRARVESGDGARFLERGAPGFNKKVDPFDADPRDLDRQEIISRSMTAIDGEDRVFISDDNKARLERMIRRGAEATLGGGQFDGGYVAMRTLFTENPLYRSAWQKYCRLGAAAQFNADEQRVVAAFQDYEIRRAASENTTTAGGFGIPVYIDPTIIVTSGAADVPMLRVCRVEQVTNNLWKGVSSAGMTWSFDTEAAEVSDDTPTLAQPSVTVHMARGHIPYSIEVGQDYPGFAMEMGKLIDSGYSDLLASVTMTGSGSGQPFGIFTALDADTFDELTPTTDGSFGGVDVFKAWNALPERYRSRATWIMSVSVESAIRQFASAAGSSSSYFTVDLTADGVSRINGRPVIVTDYAPTFTGSVPGTTGKANILVVGDCSNYLWVQRAGMSIEQIPMLFATANNLPSGQRAMFAWARVGGNSVNDLGFRLLQNT